MLSQLCIGCATIFVMNDFQESDDLKGPMRRLSLCPLCLTLAFVANLACLSKLSMYHVLYTMKDR